MLWLYSLWLYSLWLYSLSLYSLWLHSPWQARAAIDFLQVVRVRTYHEGDVICSIGDPPDDLRIVQSGTVRCGVCMHAHIYAHA